MHVAYSFSISLAAGFYIHISASAQSVLSGKENYCYEVRGILGLNQYDIVHQQPTDFNITIVGPVQCDAVALSRANDFPIYVLKFKENPIDYALVGDDSILEDDLYYWIELSRLQELIDSGFIVKRYRTWHPTFAADNLLLPVKYRPAFGKNPDRITTDVSAGPAVSLRFRMSPYQSIYLHPAAFFGMTIINLTPSNRTMYTDSVSDNIALGFTYGGGIILEINSFQAGILFGFDIASGNEARYWIYNHRPWLSFGLGYKFLVKSE